MFRPIKTPNTASRDAEFLTKEYEFNYCHLSAREPRSIVYNAHLIHTLHRYFRCIPNMDR